MRKKTDPLPKAAPPPQDYRVCTTRSLFSRSLLMLGASATTQAACVDTPLGDCARVNTNGHTQADWRNVTRNGEMA